MIGYTKYPPGDHQGALNKRLDLDRKQWLFMLGSLYDRHGAQRATEMVAAAMRLLIERAEASDQARAADAEADTTECSP